MLIRNLTIILYFIHQITFTKSFLVHHHHNEKSFFSKGRTIEKIVALKENKDSSSSSPKIDISWCGQGVHGQACGLSIREKVVGSNGIVFEGPATGQVLYSWNDVNDDKSKTASKSTLLDDNEGIESIAASSGYIPGYESISIVDDDEPSIRQLERTILLLIKKDDDELLQFAYRMVKKLTSKLKIKIQLEAEPAAKLKYYYNMEESNVSVYKPKRVPGFGSQSQIQPVVDGESRSLDLDPAIEQQQASSPPDMIVTLGGDGLLMYANTLFPGPVPPILCIAGGSLGFLTPFSKKEMYDAIQGALGFLEDSKDINDHNLMAESTSIQTTEPVSELGFDEVSQVNKRPLSYKEKLQILIGSDNQICISMRMRLDCRVVSREGVVRARFNVLNEVVIDRGSSPYLANLECFCDDVHLTTVQADGIIFATPTGSTAYSMAAGGSVVHPVVPAILVTPICPHVLSFRSMIFPDHVVMKCMVPEDARSDACVAFDGKYRRLLHRGDSVIIQMSNNPVPTVDRTDHTADWLSSLKRNFNFNTRAQQKPFIHNSDFGDFDDGYDGITMA